MIDPDEDDLIVAELDVADGQRRRVLKGAAIFFVVVLMGVLAAQWVTDRPTEADTLPEFALTTIDGEPFALRSVVGTPTVINFFATWCAPCRAELPVFETVSQDLEGQITFLGINTSETDPDQVAQLLDETGVTFPIALGDDGTLLSELGGLAMPTTVFVGADGSIVDVGSGSLTEDALRSRIEDHFDVDTATTTAGG